MSKRTLPVLTNRLRKKRNQDSLCRRSLSAADQRAYDAYDRHPKHMDFVQNRWNREVER